MPSSFGSHRMSSPCARGATASGGVTLKLAASFCNDAVDLLLDDGFGHENVLRQIKCQVQWCSHNRALTRLELCPPDESKSWRKSSLHSCLSMCHLFVLTAWRVRR